MGEQCLSHPECGRFLSSQFCLLMHTKQSSVLVRVNRQDNFDREQEFRKQWTACRMSIGEGQMPLPLCPAVVRTACVWFTLIYALIALRDFALPSWKTPSYCPHCQSWRG
ncbi:unnamed protein product [Rangifer tarandus platyrhynchus]|uniref:Uncharacterized protein n=1 Tax=Rangifer tarandus platyrhynchus TaxID=3082113 RepID=A0ABN8XR72_RANTA|nr:unnamed protein product [Rangifer tarandus platyrhynchus]CAI9181140.1 unnamed protein product [Rangifer tarandus platyrhynchus]CAI9181141.1 unnamed protein product [Rangifer tarandus platyrhynchus]